MHRGCGVADFNGDGRLDVVVLSLGSPAELWLNESAPERHWLIVRLIGTKSNRDGIGARIAVGTQVRTMTTSVGYASSSHAGAHFGLGDQSGEALARLKAVATNPVLPLVDAGEAKRLSTLCADLHEEDSLAREGYRLAMRGLLALIAIEVVRLAVSRARSGAVTLSRYDARVDELRRLVD